MNPLIARLLANKHTSIAAIVVVSLIILAQALKIWMPQYANQIDQTISMIQKTAVGYGLLMAGDSQPTKPNP